MSFNSKMVPEFLPFKKLHCCHIGNGQSRRFKLYKFGVVSSYVMLLKGT
jgi:hypothetical protein